MNIQGIILFSAYIFFWLWLGRKYGDEVSSHLKGVNARWDNEEIITITGVFLLIIAFGANLFLNYEINITIFASVELIIAFAIGSKKFPDKK